MTLKAYYVRRVSRCTVTYLIEAENAEEAAAKARDEDGRHVEIAYTDLHFLRPQRAPEEDESAPMGVAPKQATEKFFRCP